MDILTGFLAGVRAPLLPGLFMVTSMMLFKILKQIWFAEKTEMCNNTDWGLSLGSDCFRTAFLYPVILYFGTALATLVILRHFSFRMPTAPAFPGMGQQRESVCVPKGETVLHDNRRFFGGLITLASAAQAIVAGFWLFSDPTHLHDDGGYAESNFVFSITLISFALAVLSLDYYVTYLISDSLSYLGLFPSIIPVTVGIQLSLEMLETYFTFFTPERSHKPFWGDDASLRSKYILVTTGLSLVLFSSHLMIQRMSIFLRPTENHVVQSSQQSIDEEYHTGDIGEEADMTPLNGNSGKPYIPLVKTPENSSSFFSRILFSWPNDIMRKGVHHQLGYADMYKFDGDDMPVHVWKRYISNRIRGRALFTTSLITFIPELSLQAVLALITGVLSFTGPFFLQRILRFIEGWYNQRDNADSTFPSVRVAYLNVFGLLFFTVAFSLLTSQTLWIGRRIGIRFKGLLVAELSTKTLCRRGRDTQKPHLKEAKDKGSNGKGEGGNSEDSDDVSSTAASSDGRIMNLLTADFQRVTDVSAYIYHLYMTPFTLIIGIWYMYVLLGVSSLIGLSMSIIYVPITKVIASKGMAFQEVLTGVSDERIAQISELMQGIKAVKLFGWESKFIEKINEKREKQLKYTWKFLVIWVYFGSIASIVPMFILIVIFGFYVFVFGNTLTAEVAFTSITLYQLIRNGFEELSGSFSWIISGYVSLKRIDEYMDQPQVQNLTERTLGISDSGEGSDATDIGNGTSIAFVDANLEWDIEEEGESVKAGVSESRDNENQTDVSESYTESNTPPSEETPLLGDRAQDTISSSVQIGASYTTLTNNNDGRAAFSLKNINISFPEGGLTIIAGPTGSGKSSLLSAIIGEMVLTRGRIILPTANPLLSIGLDPKYHDIIKLSGEKLIVHDIAYVAQSAWLRNATIRDNILFGEPYDRSRYEEVLRMCALKPDLRILTAGDQTEIGERGVTLSGGQKQRVALARAVYSKRQILLIDDCISAVDSHTAKHILKECILGQTDIMSGRTCVLVTHHVTMCLPHCQYVVMLREGELSFKGTPDELQQHKSSSRLLAGLEGLKRSSTPTLVGKGKDSGTNTPADIASTSNSSSNSSGEISKSKVLDSKSEDQYNTERLQKISAANSDNSTAASNSALGGTLVEDEKREVGYVKAKIWFTYLKSCGSKTFWFTNFVMLILVQLSSVIQTYWIRIWVQNTNGQGSSGAGFASAAVESSSLHHSSSYGLWPLPDITNSLGVTSFISRIPYTESLYSAGTNNSAAKSAVYWLGLYVVFGITNIIWSVLQSLYCNIGSIRASRTIHNELLSTVVHAKPRFFDSTPLGRIINRFSRDMEVVDNEAMGSLDRLFIYIVAVTCILSVITWTTPQFIVVAALISIVYFYIAHYYLTASRELKRLESNTMSPLLSLFGELILGVSSIRAFGLKHYYIKEAANRINDHNMPFYLVWAANRWLSIRIDIAGALVSFSCASLIIFSIGYIDAGLAGFTLTYALMFSESMLWVVRFYNINELNMNAVERINQYLEIETEAQSHSAPENRPPESWPQTGDIEIENLTIEYTPNVPVIHNLSLSIKQGEKIGVVGRTGAGKSTLSLALLRFIEAKSGRIIIDDVDISTIGLEELRHKVTIIPQDPVLFNGTIRFNLDPFREYPDEIIWDALRRSYLVRESSNSSSSANSINGSTGDKAINNNAIDRMVGIFKSLDAEIKENGQNLSLGQRQLVALARALVRRSKLIVMDEATASVDFDTDERIQNTIRRSELAESTLFCIAHRLHTIIDYDRILVLDKGSVAEFDTPWNLLQREDSIFRDMCIQSGDYDHLYDMAGGQ